MNKTLVVSIAFAATVAVACNALLSRKPSPDRVHDGFRLAQKAFGQTPGTPDAAR